MGSVRTGRGANAYQAVLKFRTTIQYIAAEQFSDEMTTITGMKQFSFLLTFSCFYFNDNFKCEFVKKILIT